MFNRYKLLFGLLLVFICIGVRIGTAEEVISFPKIIASSASSTLPPELEEERIHGATPITLENEQLDAYHTWLRNYLQQQHGITGGSWIFSDNEATTLSQFYQYGDATLATVDTPNMPFQQALRAISPDAQPNMWNRATFRKTANPVYEGDKILMAFWIRSTEAEAGDGLVRVEFARGLPPWASARRKLIAVTPEWQLWLLPFEMNETLETDLARISIQLGAQTQQIEVGGVAALNFQQAYTLDQLESLESRPDFTYAGQDLSAAWRVAADQRIEQHRKGDLAIKVVDQDGNPISGATVNVDMQNHTFNFGSTLNSGFVNNGWPHGEQYRATLLNLDGNGHGFNLGTTEWRMQWKWWEDSPDPIIDSIDWMIAHGIRPRGHSVIWPRTSVVVPDDVINNVSNPSYVDSRVRAHIADVVDHPEVKGKLVAWDFVNELKHERAFSDSFETLPQYSADGDLVFVDWLNLAQQIDPNTPMYYNEYNLLMDGGLNVGSQSDHKRLARILYEGSNGRLDGLGFQAHISFPLTPPERLIEVFDQYAAEFPTLNFQVTEYDLNIENEQLSADYLRDFMTAVYSHPQIDAFIMWGFWDGAHWLDNAPLYREDWSPKPAHAEYVDLVFDQWWTDESGQTAGNGMYTTRGFLGDYIISAEINGHTVEVPVRNTTDTNTVVLELDTEQSANLIENGSFNTGNHPWWSSQNGSFDTSTNELCFTFSPAGIQPWDVIVGQSNVRLETGSHYHLSFKARSTSDQPINVKLGQIDSPYTTYLYEPIDLTTVMQPFDLYETIDAPTDPAAVLEFHLGGTNPATICFDDVSLQREVTTAVTMRSAEADLAQVRWVFYLGLFIAFMATVLYFRSQ